MQSLDGISVLVTRPAEQCESLAQAIESHGGVAIRAPMIIVAALTAPAQVKAANAALKRFDIAIFVSKNAVDFGLELLNKQRGTLAGKPVFAVGLGTAAALGDHGISDVQAPQREFSSEGLLRLDGLAESAISGKRIVIVRGLGGELLAETLRRRGAEVVYCECYERRKPDVTLARELKSTAIKVPDIGLATSIEVLVNLVEKIEDEGIDQLFDMQMLVVGARCGEEVRSFGFTQAPVVVENPSDESIINRLIKWVDEES